MGDVYKNRYFIVKDDTYMKTWDAHNKEATYTKKRKEALILSKIDTITIPYQFGMVVQAK